MFQQTRRQLAGWYTGVTAVVLVLLALAVYGYVRLTLVERIDDTLSHVAEVVERSIRAEGKQQVGDPFAFQALGGWDPAEDPPLDHLGDETYEYEDDHIDLEWFDATGILVWASSPHTADVPLRTGVRTVYLSSGYGLRQITDPVWLGSELLGYLRISHPWFEVTKPTRQLALDLSLGLAVMVAGVGGIGWLLSGLAMRPVYASFDRLKRFTADASHELRSPIAGLQTTVQTQLRDPQLDDQSRQTWEAMERLSRRLAQLVEDLLFLARQDQRQVDPLSRCRCDGDELALQVEAEQRGMAHAKQITLELDIPDTAEDYAVTGDPAQLLRLLTNVVINSLLYTPAGGHVWIRLRRLENKQIQIKVEDDGMGIPAQDLPHVFDRFYRADPARSGPAGTGLGLAIAKSIVERHQGSIGLQSEAGQGTTVTIVLPEWSEG